MAVEALVKNVKLQIKYLGPEVDGRQTYITKTYSKVKPEAQDQDIYDVAVILAGLQTNTVFSINKAEDSELVES
ncbi:MAG: DUF1659 domain-containing protein [Clostridiales bacterium]|nr:DUF1659 domain-containing protein [Clostridiales bacterium]